MFLPACCAFSAPSGFRNFLDKKTSTFVYPWQPGVPGFPPEALKEWYMARHWVKTTSTPWQCLNVSTQRTLLPPGLGGESERRTRRDQESHQEIVGYNHKSSQRPGHFLVNIACVGNAGRFVSCNDSKQAVGEPRFEKKVFNSLQNPVLFPNDWDGWSFWTYCKRLNSTLKNIYTIYSLTHTLKCMVYI